jgi:hypothetical protein
MARRVGSKREQHHAKGKTWKLEYQQRTSAKGNTLSGKSKIAECLGWESASAELLRETRSNEEVRENS